MEIRSHRPSHDETLVIQRAAATDPALSVTALGILTRVLASSGGSLTSEDLDAGESPGTVPAGLDQLRQAGYLIIDADGVYRVSDTPQLPPGMLIAAATTHPATRPALTPVPDLVDEQPSSPPRQLHPAPRPGADPERITSDPNESRRAARHGADLVREALARKRREHELRQRVARERLEGVRLARVEAERVARAEALATVRARADTQMAADGGGDSSPSAGLEVDGVSG